MNKEDLNELQEKLCQRQDQLHKDFFAHNHESKGLNTQELRDEIDYASASMESFLGDTIIKHHKKEYDEIEIALQKVKDGVYGICEMCGDEIDIARLHVKPHAKFCITCREQVEKANNAGRRK